MISRRNIFELKIRREIYQFINDFPGIHQREISRKLKIPKTTLKYHLRFLEKRELIVSKSEPKYTRYYIANNIGKKEKEILSLLEQETPSKIFFIFYSYKCATRNEISRALEKHPNTISYHLRKMLKLGLIEPAPTRDGFIIRNDAKQNIQFRNTSNNEIVYRQKMPQLIYDLIIAHKNSIFDDEISKALIYLIYYEPPPSKTDKMYTFETAINKVIDFYEDFIPIPFRA